MLPRTHRLTCGNGFRHAVRTGSRSASRTVVVHLAPPGPDSESIGVSTTRPPSVGFVVSKTVGNAVTRNRVQRRLRHLSRQRLDRLPAGCTVVVRALPSAADSTYAELGADLDRTLNQALARVLDRASEKSGRGRDR